MKKDSQQQQSRLAIILTAILTVIVISATLLYNNYKLLGEQEFWVRHTAEVLGELDQSISTVKDAETGTRGYLLTGNIDNLNLFESATTKSIEHLNRVNILVQDNPVQVARAAAAITTEKKRFQLLRDVQASYQKTGHLDQKTFQLSEGRVVMDELREQIRIMKSTEQELLVARTEKTETTRKVFLWVLVLSNLLTVIVIILAFSQIAKSQQRTLQEAADKAADAKEKATLANLSSVIAGDVSLEVASQKVLKYLSEQFGVLAGTLWVYDGLQLVIASSYGVQGQLETVHSPLVNASIERKGVWQLVDVPKDYWRISSGFGSAVPTVLTFIPFQFQGQNLGVLELASFSTLSDEAKETLERLSETIGVGINAAQSRTHLQALLEKTQLQSEELQAQQEELRTNNEELEQQARALESQQQALNIKNKELEVTQTELEAKAADLYRSGLYKSEFLAKMSHELRTPLNGLLILSTLLVENKEKNLTEQQKQFAKSIGNAGNDLLTLVNDILDLSKIEARKLNIRPEDFTLQELFATTKSSFEPQTSAKGLQFLADIPAEIEDLTMHTDRQRVDQILRNFLSNAIKFTDKGKIVLSAKINQKAQTIRFTVADSGIGIPKNKQEAIFEAFEQADSSVSRKYGGTGLGLTISRELSTLLGGKIALESEEGQGSKFSFEIPVRLEAQNRVDGSATTPAPRKKETLMTPINDDQVQAKVRHALEKIKGENKKILIVEDDHNFRSSIVEAVRSYGFEPIEAEDGEVAMAILGVQIPDAILLDIKLPGISGLGILEMIKQLPHLRHIPIHMISALEYQNNALRMGAFGYLTKPVTIEKIRSALGRIEDQISKKLRRVLLIEDDDVQNLAISQLIGGSDLEVVSVKTGRAAIDLVKGSGFDCIILDLTLPDVSGFDFLEELRGLEISIPPVVIYTGKDLSDKEERYLRKYSESIIIKGARSPERLLDEVNLFLHRVESFLPAEKREMLSHLRSQEKSFEGKTILVVDDDIRNVFALTSALESKGLQVRVARDGIEALEELKNQPDIDLVLMDIMMPRMDGFEAMKKIREDKDSRIKSMPVVALTAKAMKEDYEKSMDAGASDYLPKPVNLENLTTVLKVWLSPKGFTS